MARYAISDLHGHYKLYEQVKKKLKVNDLLYVLGDCADRGPDGWKTLKVVIDDPQCLLVLGNHEDMLRQTMEVWFELDHDNYPEEDIIWTKEYELLSMNGGTHTFWDWLEEPEDEQLYYYHRLMKLPLEYIIYDSRCGRPLILTHAGYTPWKMPKSVDDFVWDRNHFFDMWKANKVLDKAIVIHGHTPQQYLWEYLIEGADFYKRPYDMNYFEVLGQDHTGAELYNLTYADGHKICIDPGTIMSKRGILMNLDTLEQEIIKF